MINSKHLISKFIVSLTFSAVLLLAIPFPAAAVTGKLFIFTSYGAGQSITAEGGGTGPISASNTNRGSFEQFDIVVRRGNLRDGAVINIRGNNSQFVCAEGGGGGDVNCNRNVAGIWETFSIFKANAMGSGQPILPKEYVRIQTINGNFLKTKNYDGTGAIVATGDDRTKEGMFLLESIDGELPPLVTDDLKMVDFPGSAFTTNNETPMGLCYLKEEDAIVFQQPTPSGHVIGIWTQLFCERSLNGVRINPEYFRGITLRNGWHIVDFIAPDTSDSGCSSSVRSSPVMGSNNPYVQLHMSCGAWKSIAQNVVSVTVAGPRGWSMQ